MPESFETLAANRKHPSLRVIGHDPFVVETPESLLDDETTPTDLFYIRSHGHIPSPVERPEQWTLSVTGEVTTPLQLSLRDLQSQFETINAYLLIECAGNGRSFFEPKPPGNQWHNGGAGCALWTGVRLADVLKAAGLRPSAKFTMHHAADHSIGDPKRPALGRGMPVAKAIDAGNLIAWAMNGEPLRPAHGFPLRLVVPGWPASLSQKWLTGISLRDRPADGPGTGGTEYRIPKNPIRPGDKTGAEKFRDLESLPVRSIITSPEDEHCYPAGTRRVVLRGAAWAGDHLVQSVEVSIDGGAHWHPAKLHAPRNRYDWQRWIADVALPGDGYFDLCVRATDSNGVSQPVFAQNWNPQGYAANPIHRIGVTVG